MLVLLEVLVHGVLVLVRLVDVGVVSRGKRSQRCGGHAGRRRRASIATPAFLRLGREPAHRAAARRQPGFFGRGTSRHSHTYPLPQGQVIQVAARHMLARPCSGRDCTPRAFEHPGHGALNVRTIRRSNRCRSNRCAACLGGGGVHPANHAGNRKRSVLNCCFITSKGTVSSFMCFAVLCVPVEKRRRRPVPVVLPWWARSR